MSGTTVEVIQLEPGTRVIRSTLLPEQQNLLDPHTHLPQKPLVRKPAQLIILRRSDSQKSISLQVLLDDRLRLRRPIAVTLEQEGDYFIAYCNEFEEFGYGYDSLQAVDDFRQTLSELYWSLKSDHDRLAPEMTRLWKSLSKSIDEI